MPVSSLSVAHDPDDPPLDDRYRSMERAVMVVTAVLADDLDLAYDLSCEAEDPDLLAVALARCTAMLMHKYAHALEADAADTWARWRVNSLARRGG
jgi:hypothetical protein